MCIYIYIHADIYIHICSFLLANFQICDTKQKNYDLIFFIVFLTIQWSIYACKYKGFRKTTQQTWKAPSYSKTRKKKKKKKNPSQEATILHGWFACAIFESLSLFDLVFLSVIAPSVTSRVIVVPLLISLSLSNIYTDQNNWNRSTWKYSPILLGSLNLITFKW